MEGEPSQLELIQNELDRFEFQPGSGTASVKHENRIQAARQEAMSDGSSLSFVDIDDAVACLKELQMSSAQSITNNELSNPALQPPMTVNSLRASTNYDAIANASPDSFISPHQSKLRVQELVNQEDKGIQLTKQNSDQNCSLLQSMQLQLQSLQNQINKFESKLEVSHDTSVLGYHRPQSAGLCTFNPSMVQAISPSSHSTSGRKARRSHKTSRSQSQSPKNKSKGSSLGEIIENNWTSLRNNSQKNLTDTGNIQTNLQVHVQQKKPSDAPLNAKPKQVKHVRNQSQKNNRKKVRTRSASSMGRSNSRTRQNKENIRQRQSIAVYQPDPEEHGVSNEQLLPQQHLQQSYNEYYMPINAPRVDQYQQNYNYPPPLGMTQPQHQQPMPNQIHQSNGMWPPNFKQEMQGQQMQSNNQNLLYFQTQETEKYRNKCKELKKQMTKLKSQLADKDKLITKQKNIYKEIKTMKDQWRASETIRTDQVKQIRDLQIQLLTAQNENKKLRKHFSRATEVPKKDKRAETMKSSEFGASPTEQITPIRVAIMSKKAGGDRMMAQDQLFM